MLSELAKQGVPMVGFIGSANMLEDGGKHIKTCREAGMEPLLPSGASFTIAPDTDLDSLIFKR